MIKVLIALDYSFPNSTAQSNRMLSIIKAINIGGNQAQVLCIRGTYNSDEKAPGISDGLNVRYSCSPFRNKNFIIRNIFKPLCYSKALFEISKINRTDKIDYMFLPVKNNLFNTIVYFCSRIAGVKILHERSEYPEIYVKGVFSKASYFYYTKIFAKMLDGFVVMTDTLKGYYSKIKSANASITTLPMSVDIERFDNIQKESYSKKYIAYCGNISNKKDGVDILIRSFSIVVEKFMDLHLYLIGGSSDRKLISELKILCKELGIDNKVVFTGKVSAEEMPGLLKNASLLALARPTSLQSQGGFPTKLGEYLATKNPVVVTAVGEIEYYLQDGVSAFISKPDCAESFAEKISECLSDPEASSEIGKKGYEVARKYFHYKSQAWIINKFLEENIK